MEPKNLERRDIDVSGVYDIETADWTQFVVGGIAYADGAYERHWWTDEEAMVDSLLAIRGDVWAQNGGRFDHLWLLDRLIARGIKCRVIAAGARIVSLEVTHGAGQGRTRFCDSRALTRLSLAEFTEGLAGGAKIATGLECRCGGGCGGYCAISRGDMSAGDRRSLEKYLERDCRSLLAGMTRLRDFAAEHDLDLGLTIGSAAWRTARRVLSLPPASLSPGDHAYARRAYYGGRVTVGMQRCATGHHYDVNSMYPSQLAARPVPVGCAVFSAGHISGRHYASGRPGVYEASVSVRRDTHLGPLPVRCRWRVAYPTGIFRGVWTRDEIVAAERHGARVLKIWSGLVWPAEEVLFGDFMERIFAVRAASPGGKKGAMGTFAKFFMNSLTGKFGSRPEVEVVEIDPDEIRGCPGNGRCTRSVCSGFCGAHTALDGMGRIYTRRSYRLAPCAHVEWAATLTAGGRIEWLDQALSLGDGGVHVAYGDTDSIYSSRVLARHVGTSLGEWADEGPFSGLEVRAPKVYRVRHGAAPEYAVAAKGVSRCDGGAAGPDALWGQILSGAPIKSGGAIIGFRQGARAGSFFHVGVATRSIAAGCGDRIAVPGRAHTRAPQIEECEI